MASRSPVKPGLSSREVDDLYSSVRDARKFADERRDASPSTLRKIGERTIDAVEVVGGAAAIGFVAGWTGSPSIGPLPTGLGVAGAYYVAEAFDLVPGSWSRHLENVLGKGALAGTAAMWAAGQGYMLKQNMQGGGKKPAVAQGVIPQAMVAGMPAAALAPGARVGCPPPAVPSRLTEAELQAIDLRRSKR